MTRTHYKLFSEGQISSLTLPNRLVRSATWDPSIIHAGHITQEVLDCYRALAEGGVGMIITGGLPIMEQDMLANDKTYADIRVEGIEQMAALVHEANPRCKVIAQVEAGSLSKGPSEVPTPFSKDNIPALSVKEIEKMIACFVEAITSLQRDGFDGVQLHAAHGGCLSAFLSPYTNQRTDTYGGSVEKRAAIVRKIVAGARAAAGDFPILIKLNATDNVAGGIDLDTFPALAEEMEQIGFDAIEVSGGMWNCLVRSEEELGFPPVPMPESHTKIHKPEKQSYYLKYSQALDLDIPVILVGGNRDVEALEEIVQQGKVDFIALCRPLIAEPDLPERWRAGRGKRTTDCISCNACVYEMFVHPGKDAPGLVRCTFMEDKALYRASQEWLAGWVERFVVTE